MSAAVLLLSNNAKDFEALHHQQDHADILLYHDQSLPDDDPEGLARAVEEVIDQYGLAELANSVVELDEWIHEK
jgi:DNA-binding phage protein